MISFKETTKAFLRLSYYNELHFWSNSSRVSVAEGQPESTNWKGVEFFTSHLILIVIKIKQIQNPLLLLT